MAFQAELRSVQKQGWALLVHSPSCCLDPSSTLAGVSLNVIRLKLTARLYISSTFHLIFSHSSY